MLPILRRFPLAARMTDVNKNKLQIVQRIWQPITIACMALTYRPSDYLMEDNILHILLVSL